MKWNESGFRPPLCTYRLNWARRTSWGWWDDWDDTVLQTQDSKFEPWRSEAEHATSRSRRLPTILTFTRGWGRNIFASFKPPRPGTEPRTLAWKAAVLTTTLGPPPSEKRHYSGNNLHKCYQNKLCRFRGKWADSACNTSTWLYSAVQRQQTTVTAIQWTQNIWITLLQRRPNGFGVVSTLYKCYTNILWSLGLPCICSTVMLSTWIALFWILQCPWWPDIKHAVVDALLGWYDAGPAS